MHITIVLVIYIQNKLSIGYLVIAEDEKNHLNLGKPKGNNSALTDATLIKFHMYNLTIIIYIQYTFYEIPSIGYLVIAEDGKNNLNLGNQRAITLL